MYFLIWKSPLIILLFLGYKAISVAGEPSKLRITRLPNGPELSSPLVVSTGQTLTIYCAALNTDRPETVRGLHWRFNNNSRVPVADSEYDVGMVVYPANNTWIAYLRINRIQLSFAGTYKCVANFSGMPKSRSMEIQVSACSDPGALTNGRFRLTNSTTVTYTCDSGYRLRGASTRHCTAKNRFLTGSVPRCIPIRCINDPPSAPMNGNKNNHGRTVGSTVAYSCDPGYSLHGDNRSTCMANGEWSGQANTTCIPVDCADPGTLTNGQHNLSSTTYNSVVIYTCDVGYTLQGSNSTTCQSNGQWSGSVPQCKRVPSRVTGLSLSKTVSSRLPTLRATWTTPQSDEPISQYHLQYRKHGTSSWGSQHIISSSPPPNFNIVPRLAAGTEYNVRVRAESAVGAGSWSAVQTERTYMKPPSPNHHTVSAVPVDRRGVIRVSWTAPTVPSGELPITGYSIRYKVNSSDSFRYKSVMSNFENEVTSLNPGTVYCVYVAGVSAIGRGSYCCEGTPVLVRTYNVPSQVAGLAVSKATLSGKPALSVTWTTPQSDVPISQYQVEYRRSGTNWRAANPVSPGSATSTLLEALDVGAVYEVRIRAVSAIGNGAWSRVESEMTYRTVNCGSAPDAPANGLRSGSGTTVGSTVTYSCNPGYTLQGDSRRTCMANGQWSGVTTRCSRTPMPNVTLGRSSLDSLLIRWSVSSTEYLNVTNYTVYWSGPSSEAYNTISTGYNNYTIKGLHSNSPYTIAVEAIDPLGRQNSTNLLYFTSPAAPSMKIAILPEFALQVMWTPAPDASHSSLTYVINVTVESGSTEKPLSASLPHPISMERFTGFSSYSVGSVLLQAANRGAMSKAVSVSFRMVNLTGEVSKLTAEWINNTTLRVKWEPVQVTVGVSAAYTVNSSPIIGITDELLSLPEANVTEFQMSKATMRNFIIMDNLYSSLFYHVRVMVHLNQFHDPSVAIGIGSTVALVVLAMTAVLSTILCCCLWWKRHSSHVKRFKGIISTQRAAQKSKLNEPVAVANHVTLDLYDVNDKEVDNQVPPNPVYGNAGITHSDPNAITKRLFPARVREMHRNGNEGFEEEFQLIHDDPNGSSSIAQVNKSKNRYLNTNTFDHSRVILRFPDESGSDYINASYIAGYVQANTYIAAQGPKREEVSIFWQMIWEHQPSVVVMLTNVKENGKQKCEQYWTNDLDKPYDAGRGFSVVTTGYRSFADYEVRDLTIRKSTDRPHKLTHFQYTAWPDHGVPLHPSSLVKFVQEVRKVYGNSPAPMVVHCSAGVGRTGTFITLDAMMERLKERDELNIFEFVNEMRTRRKQMVQTLDQYAFIHDALSDYITCGDTSMMAHELRGAIADMNKKDGTGKSGFENQFEFMDSVCKIPVGEDLSFAKKSMVAKRNRYKEKFPYSTNYLHIAGRPPSNAADYINATMMASYSSKRGLVAAQAPLESTRTDVWELIWQLKTKNIVLLGPVKEGKKVMCSQFWPTEELHSVEYGQLVVTFVSTTTKPDWEMTMLQVSDKNRSSCTSLNVTLFHFLSWPREGRPPIDSMLKMMGEVEKKQKDIKAPLMVMCDDGMSRSGVFITCMTEIERVKVEGGVDIFQTVKAARAQRPFMVNTSDQYKLCFEILQSHLDSFDTYANFKAV